MGYHSCDSFDRCINVNGTYNCSCLPGYHITDNGKSCVGMLQCRVVMTIFTFIIDTNECNTNNGGCDHICINADGSYQCLCGTGFTLGSDERNCYGM